MNAFEDEIALGYPYIRDNGNYKRRYLFSFCSFSFLRPSPGDNVTAQVNVNICNLFNFSPNQLNLRAMVEKVINVFCIDTT